MNASETGYQGWKNYPTWAVDMWLSNDERLYNEALKRVRGVVEYAADHPNVATDIWTIEQTRRFVLADDLKSWVTDELAPDLGATFAADLLGYALGEVDWHEIADAWIESVAEQV
jgi:hypothetical protein